MGLDQFHHRITGNPAGHKLVFLHGLMGALNNWGRVTPAFEKDFQILTFDQRGHGRSFKPATGYAAKDFAMDLRMILDELRWESVYLVGHSLGGRNALEFATLFPQRAIKLVVEDIAPGMGQRSMLDIKRLIELVPTPFADHAAANRFFDREYAKLIAWHPSPDVICRFLYSNLEEKPGRSWDWRFNKAGILEALHLGHTVNHWKEIEGLTMPTLWLRGSRSTDLSRVAFEEVLARNQVITGAEIPDAGHWIHFEQPEAFIQVVKEFLTSP